MKDKDNQALYHKALELCRTSKYQEALPLLTELRKDHSYRLKADTNIGGCLLHLGHIRAGMKFTMRALNQDPGFFPALLNQAEAQLAMGNATAAIETYSELTKIGPENELVAAGMIKALYATGQEREALEAADRFLLDSQNHIPTLLIRGEILSNLGDHQNAIKSFGIVLGIEPSNEKAYSNLSVVMIRQSKLDIALQYIEKTIAINPDSLTYRCRKALCQFHLSLTREARDSFRIAYEKDTSSVALFLSQHLVIPSIPESAREIEESRLSFAKGLELAENNSTLTLDIKQESIAHTFFLAYHNKNDRLLLERYANLMRKLARPLIATIPLASPKKQHSEPKISGRLRIGLLSEYFCNHSNALAFEGLIKHLDRNRFEVFLIHTNNAKNDSTRESLDKLADHSVQLPSDLHGISHCLMTLNLAILYFTDIGMNPYDFLYPMLKSTPIQITGWGIPHTSGIKEVDYYISADGLEPDQADDLYTETLVRLPGSLPCCFLSDSLTLIPLPREYFMLPPTGLLVGCLQNLHKLHPDFDSLLETIALKNPDVGFVFVEDPSRPKTKRFLERLERNAPNVFERCIPLALMKRTEYHALCNRIDLLLDPIYYGSGITFFEASFVGTPIVTLEGEFLRSRVVAGGYREMGLDEPPIAASPSEYVDITTDLLQNSIKRKFLKEEILTKNKRIFNRLDYVKNFEDFCITAVKKATIDRS